MNLASLIAQHAATQAAKPAVESRGEVLGYAAFDERARRLAARLQIGRYRTR